MMSSRRVRVIVVATWLKRLSCVLRLRLVRVMRVTRFVLLMRLTVTYGRLLVALLLLSRCVTPGRLSLVRTRCLRCSCCWLLLAGKLWTSPSVVCRANRLLVCLVRNIAFTLLVLTLLRTCYGLTCVLCVVVSDGVVLMFVTVLVTGLALSVLRVSRCCSVLVLVGLSVVSLVLCVVGLRLVTCVNRLLSCVVLLAATC